jgi:hypothetical protein
MDSTLDLTPQPPLHKWLIIAHKFSFTLEERILRVIRAHSQVFGLYLFQFLKEETANERGKVAQKKAPGSTGISPVFLFSTSSRRRDGFTATSLSLSRTSSLFLDFPWKLYFASHLAPVLDACLYFFLEFLSRIQNWMRLFFLELE